jgi:DNA (cytosine-5)-methyltransferase 1
VALTVGSLFSGIGGLDFGLERAGMKVKWQVEIDDYARRVLRKHWPDVRLYSDVREVGAHNLESVDVLCGGFPCTNISNAGKREGIDGPQSGLWKEFARIIEEIRPRFVLIENVAVLRSRGLQRVLQDLTARGYDAEWDCIPAAALGAPHRRDRIFVVAYARVTNAERLVLRDESGRSSGANGEDTPEFGNDGAEGFAANPDRERFSQRSERNGDSQTGIETPHGYDTGRRDPDVAHAHESGLEGRVFDREYAGELLTRARGESYARYWSSESGVLRVAHGVPDRMDRNQCCGNAVVPQVAEYVGRLIVAAAGKGVGDACFSSTVKPGESFRDS